MESNEYLRVIAGRALREQAIALRQAARAAAVMEAMAGKAVTNQDEVEEIISRQWSARNGVEDFFPKALEQLLKASDFIERNLSQRSR